MSRNLNDPVLTAAPKRGRGRPRDLEKRAAIVEAAAGLFFERGIAATTMEAVAERASVSKMTLYSHFADKPVLLAAVFDRNLKALELPRLVEDPAVSPLDQLSEFGVRLVLFLTRPEIVRAARVVAAGADDFPVLAAAFFAAGPATVIKTVGAFLAAIRAREKLRIPDPELAAEQLVAAWLGVDQLRQSLGIGGPPTPDAVSRRVKSATTVFFRGWATSAAFADRS
jgi:TetR/AcrR family transcriptional repressor of mexJK operon